MRRHYSLPCACKAHKKRKTKKERLLYDKARVDAAEKAFRNALKSGLKKAERIKEARREFLKGDGMCLFIQP